MDFDPHWNYSATCTFNIFTSSQSFWMAFAAFGRAFRIVRSTKISSKSIPYLLMCTSNKYCRTDNRIHLIQTSLYMSEVIYICYISTSTSPILMALTPACRGSQIVRTGLLSYKSIQYWLLDRCYKEVKHMEGRVGNHSSPYMSYFICTLNIFTSTDAILMPLVPVCRGVMIVLEITFG